MATLEEQVKQLQAQQSLQSRALAALLANHYQDGPQSAKGLLVQLDPDTYTDLAVVEKENAPKADGGGGDADYPVTWIGSPNHYVGDFYGGGVWAIVIHTMGGSIEGTDSWFGTPDSQVSSHYGTALDGRLHQYVSLENGAWANGILESGNAWEPYFGSHENPNHHSISVESEDGGSGKQVVTEAEYGATAAACRLALARWPSIHTLTVHRAISPDSRPQCAGDRWWGSSGCLQRLAGELGLELLL